MFPMEEFHSYGDVIELQNIGLLVSAMTVFEHGGWGWMGFFRAISAVTQDFGLSENFQVVALYEKQEVLMA